MSLVKDLQNLIDAGKIEAEGSQVMQDQQAFLEAVATVLLAQSVPDLLNTGDMRFPFTSFVVRSARLMYRILPLLSFTMVACTDEEPVLAST